MATEEELIRKLRALYGISPEGADRQSFDADIQRLQDELNQTPETITERVRPARMSRTGKVRTVANPARERLQQQLLDLQGRRAQGPDRSLVTEAATNRGLLDSIFGGIKRSTLDDGTRELNRRFTDALRGDASSMAARGLTGGSADRSRKSRTLADLLLGRQRLVSAAEGAEQTGRVSLDEQRQATERQIKLGTQPDVSTINALQQASAGVNQAYRGLTEQALGGLLVRGGDSYRDINQADAYGRRGWGTLSPSQGRTGSSSGSFY